MMPGPPPSLRSYQERAVSSWEANAHLGIFAMATGTGKTFTAMVALERLLENRRDLDLLVVVVPFQHLADQWFDELAKRGVSAFRAFEDTAAWTSLWDLRRRRDRALGTATYVLTTYATLGSEPLQWLLAAEVRSLVLVADECHYLGARRTRQVMALPVPARLGLSATPSRHFDDEGTNALMDFFGGIVFEFDLASAIRDEYLTPYEYFPEAVSLSNEEFAKYHDLTNRLGRAMARAGVSGLRDDEQVKSLARRRARLLNNAVGKVAWLRHKLERLDPEALRHSLVYVGDRSFAHVLAMIGRDLGIPAHAFTSEQTRRERAMLLRRFESGELAVLVAMKCLDEGVDVPPTRTAYFLASSSNPREFVQRRGRILRRSPGKRSASVYDAIAVPPQRGVWASFDTAERAAIRTQYARIAEFGRHAMNAVAADRAVLELRLAADLPLEPAANAVARREGTR